MLKVLAGMLGTETDSVVGVRESAVSVEGVSFLLQAAIRRQTNGTVTIVFFIRNRFLLVVINDTKPSTPGLVVDGFCKQYKASCLSFRDSSKTGQFGSGFGKETIHLCSQEL